MIPQDIKKKVIVFTGALSSGGAEKQSILLAKALKPYYTITIISYYGERELERYLIFLKEENINYIQLKGSFFKKIKVFTKELRVNKPYAIINFLPSNNVIGGLIGKLFGVKRIIGGVRSSRQSTLKYFELLISHHLFNHKTVFNNYAGLEYFGRRGFSKSKSFVITNSLYPIPERIVKKSNEQIIILIVSRFETYKDYNTALNSFKLLVENTKREVFLDIVGTGPLETDIRNWVKENDMERRIKIHINPENIFDYYRRAYVFLQTSLFEGFSNSIMEAMSYSLPIIATDVGDNQFLVRNNENGFLCPVGVVEKIAECLKILVENSEKRICMGNKSYDYIQKNMSLDKFGSEFKRLIEEE